MTFTINARDKCISYITKDGSTIREIMKAANQSLAEATVLPGQTTAAHYHIKTEEIYYILRGRGMMCLEEEEREVGAGDAVLIPPGQRHSIRNTGKDDLVFLCCCAPGYSHEDTVLV
jgi:mannose-6-phosphate isomerase-like protein (cupin superfamily)